MARARSFFSFLSLTACSVASPRADSLVDAIGGGRRLIRFNRGLFISVVGFILSGAACADDAAVVRKIYQGT
uniref:Secreted protein n=1 Tax=Panstrongylus lignarius TaxID=156445 RepID=A0A224XU46_9HEMI